MPIYYHTESAKSINILNNFNILLRFSYANVFFYNSKFAQADCLLFFNHLCPFIICSDLIVIRNFQRSNTRRRSHDPVNIILLGGDSIKVQHSGSKIEKGEPLAILHVNKPETIEAAKKFILEAITIGDEQVEPRKLIEEVVE